MADFRVEQIDHVELFVPERRAAATWYAGILGLEVLAELDHWEVSGGPLMLSSDGGNTKLALFEGEPQGSHQMTGYVLVAFRVGGEAFVEFVERLDSVELSRRTGGRLDADDIVDHDVAYSIYFLDPYGNHLEITTYDYEHVSSRMDRLLAK